MGKFRRRATWRYQDNFKRNEEIRIENIRVVLPDDWWVKDMRKSEALAIAKEAWVDLVLISPNTNPPICKIIDYWQFLYEQKKKENLKHKNNKQSEVKWIRLTFNIGQHDFDIKVKKARQFLEEKNFVKVNLMFRWREVMHAELWMEKVTKFIEELSDVWKVEQAPVRQWRTISALILPAKTK